MDAKIIEQFFNALEKIMEVDEPYADKVAAMKAWMGEREDIHIEEFLSWFDKV